MAFSTQLFIAAFLIVLAHVAGHSYMTSPISRSNQAQSQSGCRGPSCLGPCDIPISKATRAPIVASRGQTIRVDWPRNNHAGGFIRLAWAPTSQSDSHAAFDAHVQQINCHEIGNPTPGQCAPADPVNDPNGGGSGPGDGSSGACNVEITVPLDLADGKWTLQWAWFGGAFSLGDYYSCADYSISGGALGVMTPVFKGGDFSYPNQQKCKFFNTNKLHVCTQEPCERPLFNGPQSGIPALGQLGTIIQDLVPSVPSVTVPTPSAKPSTTGRVRSTTGATVVPAPSSTTSPAKVPVPAPAPVPATQSTTSVVQTLTPASELNNCAGAPLLSTSSARIVSIDSWGSAFHGVIEVIVDEAILSDWVVEVQWPASGLISVKSSFNAGTLQCENIVSSFFKPSASWSNSFTRGSTIQVEFVASQGGLTKNQLLSGTTLSVLKH